MHGLKNPNNASNAAPLITWESVEEYGLWNFTIQTRFQEHIPSIIWVCAVVQNIVL